MEVAQDFIEKGHPIRTVLRHSNLSKSSYYYKPKGTKSGRKPYAVMLDNKGRPLSEQKVVKQIEKLFSNPFVDYGSQKTYIYLRDELKYKISKHKVYNIMRNNGLTRKRYQESSKKTRKNWVKDLIPQVNSAFNFFEFDIKFVWIEGLRRNIQVLTVLDVYSRYNMGQFIGFNISSTNVKALFDQIITKYGLPEKFTVRCDNGSQFIANEVQLFLSRKGVTQEFTKPSTPQQNAHIESYHSIMEKAICQRFSFDSKTEFIDTMDKFRKFYNFDRIHGGIGFISPYNYLMTMIDDIVNQEYQKPFSFVKSNYNQFKKVS